MDGFETKKDERPDRWKILSSFFKSEKESHLLEWAIAELYKIGGKETVNYINDLPKDSDIPTSIIAEAKQQAEKIISNSKSSSCEYRNKTIKN